MNIKSKRISNIIQTYHARENYEIFTRERILKKHANPPFDWKETAQLIEAKCNIL
jgi:hypothetical protein